MPKNNDHKNEEKQLNPRSNSTSAIADTFWLLKKDTRQEQVVKLLERLYAPEQNRTTAELYRYCVELTKQLLTEHQFSVKEAAGSFIWLMSQSTDTEAMVTGWDDFEDDFRNTRTYSANSKEELIAAISSYQVEPIRLVNQLRSEQFDEVEEMDMDEENTWRNCWGCTIS